MIEVSEAILQLLEYVPKNEKYTQITIEDAKGYITGQDIYADIDVPSFPKSAMDGYAVKSQDISGASKENPKKLKVIGELFAGEYKDITYEENTAVRVMTGSYIPEGYNAVVKQEDTDYGSEEVAIYGFVKPYQNYCKIGEDIEKGQLLLKKNVKLTSLHIGLLASLGISKVNVLQPLKVSIISTGTELMLPGNELQKAKIYNSISYILSSEIKTQNAEVVRNVICEDESDKLKELIDICVKDSDVIITTGGVSVGKKDLLPEIMDVLGAQRIFKGLNIQPGTPTMASVYKEKIILSLSGNPYAAYANFEMFFWEILSKYMGNKEFLNTKKCAILSSEYNKTSRLRRLIRAYEEDGKVTIPSSVHASSVISNMTMCNCFIDVKENQQISIGDKVDIIMLKE